MISDFMSRRGSRDSRRAEQEGLSNQEIGERLSITERTVRFYVTSIFDKLGADNRAQAVPCEVE
jgi:DNA-binding NarL/FixJ family response regulator